MYKNILLTISLIMITFFLAIMYHKNNALEQRVNTIYKENKNLHLKSEKSFKEDFYIIQQERDTTLILACIGSGLVVFSFLTFHSTISTVKHEISKMKENYTKHSEEYKKQHNNLLSLKARMDFNSYIGLKVRAKGLLNEGFPHSVYLDNMLEAYRIYTQYYTWVKEYNKKIEPDTLKELITGIIHLYNDIQDKKINVIDKRYTLQLIKQILEIDNPEIDEVLSLIVAKISL